jgi:hypothetical protein
VRDKRIKEIDITGKTEDEIKQMLRLAELSENEIDTVLGMKGLLAESEVQFRSKRVIVKWGKGE